MHQGSFRQFEHIQSHQLQELLDSTISNITIAVHHFYFNRIASLWNFFVSRIDLSLSIHTIKRNILTVLWNHFLSHFDLNNPCWRHITTKWTSLFLWTINVCPVNVAIKLYMLYELCIYLCLLKVFWSVILNSIVEPLDRYKAHLVRLLTAEVQIIPILLVGINWCKTHKRNPYKSHR